MFTSVLKRISIVLMPFPRTASNQVNMAAGHPQTFGNVHSDGQLIALSWNPITYVWMCAHWMSRSDGASDSRGSPAT